MALIPSVGRKSWKIRILIAMLYVALSIGALTMVYPFLIMLSTSIKSSVDMSTYTVVPQYLHDDSALFTKYAEIKYGGDIEAINGYYHTNFARLQDLKAPGKAAGNDGNSNLVRDWNEFACNLPMKYKQANYTPLNYAPSLLLDKYREFLKKRYSNDINALNKAYREENTSFEQVFNPFERPTKREWQPDDGTKMKEWYEFLGTLPSDYLRIVGCDQLYSEFLSIDKFDGDISKLNSAYGTRYKTFSDVHLSSTSPINLKMRQDWEEYMRFLLPFRYMEVSSSALPVYREFLSRRYVGDIARFNNTYKMNYTSFSQIGLPKNLPVDGIPLSDWSEFISKAIPVSMLKPINAENLFRDYALKKYGSVEKVRQTYGIHISNNSELSPPYYLSDWSYLQAHKAEIKKHFLTRNYVLVIDYILLHGRAVFNTVIFCLAVILIHLIVNPLCAYALSRYNLAYSYKVLLFLLATMAFPAEVAMIPNFLLLKQLNMLNTFWALILPGMASGFSIFLLKGFFDSLPKELYEAGIIDGASELSMFWKITMPLSKPIFAVIALQSFTAAYGAFMFAFLVCQNPKMWTMMVWLYELQITAPKYITMAALSVAALPTLLVFIFAQNVIMRGIILPSFK